MQDNKRPQENERTVRDALHSRAFKNGAYASVLCAVMLALVVALNLFVGALPAKYLRYDMTENKLYSLSQETEDLCAALTQDVTFYYLGRTGQEDAAVTELLDKYKDASSHIQVVQKDPVLYPTFGAAYDAADAAVGSIIAVCGERYRVVDAGDLYTYTPNYQTYTYDTEFDGEGALTSALSYVASEEAPLLYTLSGHGEAGLSATLTDGAERQNMSFETPALLTADAVPEDAAAVVLNAPTKDISAEEAERLRRETEKQKEKSDEYYAQIKQEKEKAAQQARKEAQYIIDDARRAADAVYEELKQLRKQAKNGAFVPGSNEKQAQMRRSLNEAESRMQPQREEKQRPEPTRAIRVGDTVELLKLGTKASVLAINKDGSYQLRAGIMQITAKPEEVYLLENETQNAAKKVIAGKVRELKAAAQPELDIRGMAVDEALPVLDNFLDAAYMGNLPNARIIHGKGTGVLRAAVQEELRRCKYVKSFRLGVYGEGESGVTIVEFK